MPIINRIPINSDNDDNYDTARNYDLFSIGSAIAVQQEDGGPWINCWHRQSPP